MRYTSKQKKHGVCSKDKEGCKGAIWTSLYVTAVGLVPFVREITHKAKNKQELDHTPTVVEARRLATSKQLGNGEEKTQIFETSTGAGSG
ncbi:hypothetical protein T05_7154 [Trichinella murrelli]|uniref:FLYWCH-type domain-containing protein n=1 Tax=Trichinella murrelli TaxID=144512 RepID=A0A0V0U460_9BILA|nr:hypothetical protein T05_7154 [Trichinella murrelli]